MKMKGIYILLVSLIWVHVAGAQGVTQDSYNSAVNYLNCSAVGHTLKGDVADRFNAKCPCERTNFANIKSFLDEAGNLDATNQLASEIDKLKGEYKKELTKEETVAFLSNTIFSDKAAHPKLFAFAEKRKGDDIDKFKASLADYLSSNLKPIAVAGGTGDTGKAKRGTAAGSGENRGNGENRSGGAGVPDPADKGNAAGVGWSFIIYSLIFAFALAGGTLYLALSMSGKKRREELDRKGEELMAYVKDQIGKLQLGDKEMLNEQLVNNKKNNNKNNKELPATKNEVQDLFGRVNTLESLVEKIREKNEAPAAPPPPPTQKEVAPVEEPVVETRKETFYLSTPNSDGTFNDRSSYPSFKEGASIYKFTKSALNKATFCIDEREASIKLALQYPDKSIDPVCEALNAYNPKATRIVTKEPGTAELQGDKWVIQNKAKITYES